MDKFEKLIKDSIQGHEASYSADAWKSLNKKLGPSKAAVTKWIAGSAAVIALLVVSYNYSQTDIVNDEQDVLIAEQLIEPNSSKKILDISTDANHELTIEEEVNVKETTVKTEKENNSSTAIKNTNKATESIAEIEGTQHETSVPNDSEAVDLFKPFNNNNNGDIVSGDGPSALNDKLVSKFQIDNRIKCQSESFNFSALKTEQKAIYEWNLGDGTVTEGSVIDHKYNTAGSYTIQLTLKDLKSNKILQKSAPIDITVLSVPHTNFVIEHSNGIMPTTNFRNETSEIVSTEWEIVGLHASNRADINYSFRHKGNFVVNLTTTKVNGCSTTATKIVQIEKDYNLLAPTAFSPNEDNLNDNFIPKALPVLNLPFTMTIYDRQGKMVYQTSDANQPWNGLYTKDQVPAPDGVYIWVVQLTNERGEIELYQDQVTIAK